MQILMIQHPCPELFGVLAVSPTYLVFAVRALRRRRASVYPRAESPVVIGAGSHDRSST